MRGQLLLASARTPYMRAGLAWPSREGLRLDIRELDGERLKELLDDPVVTVSIGGDNGVFKPLASMLIVSLDGPALQLMIDAMAEELPPIGAAVETSDDAAGAEMMARLRDAGWLSAEDAIDELAKLRGELSDVNAEKDDLAKVIVELNSQIATLKDAGAALSAALDAAKADLGASADEAAALKARVAELEAAVRPATATKKPKPPVAPA